MVPFSFSIGLLLNLKPMTQAKINKLTNGLLIIATLALCGLIYSNIWLFRHQQTVIIDIDKDEMQAMSTDSLHPDPALVWRDQNNITHVSYNYSK